MIDTVPNHIEYEILQEVKAMRRELAELKTSLESLQFQTLKFYAEQFGYNPHVVQQFGGTSSFELSRE